jgi:CheY-like chemotaxis protein
MDLHFGSSSPWLGNTRMSGPLTGLSVLVVDDSREVRESLAALLGAQGMNVMLAASGEQALQKLTMLGTGRLPHILICDIAMPDQDGYLTLSRIREWEAGNDVIVPIPAIAFTASALRQEKLKSMSYGFNAHLTKPVMPERLYATISDMVRLRKLLMN